MDANGAYRLTPFYDILSKQLKQSVFKSIR
nr:hypothetical protein [Moritella sp.]